MIANGGAVRWDLSFSDGAEIDQTLEEVLCDFSVSWVSVPSGISLWASWEDAEEVRECLLDRRIRVIRETKEVARDWVAESASLRLPVAVGRYLLDPHDGVGATPGEGRQRLHLPAARAFGTGSHESTRLAIRLLMQESFPGQRVLDVGCGAGTLAFVAALEGAASVVALDIDLDAALATREHGLSNRVRGIRPLAAPVSALVAGPRFDLVVANMLQEELHPHLGSIRALLKRGGVLLTSGQLRSREAEWLAILESERFSSFRLVTENEWLGVAASLL